MPHPPTTRPRTVLRSRAAFATGLTVLLFAAAGCTPGAWAQSASGSEVRAASGGIYVDAQADRGEATFARSCASCHGADLSGGMGPRLVPLDPFRWSEATVASLMRFVQGNMPMNAPGSLSEEAYLDVIAFLLRSNGHPSGDEPLPSDLEELEHFVLDDPPTGDANDEPEEVQDDDTSRY